MDSLYITISLPRILVQGILLKWVNTWVGAFTEVTPTYCLNPSFSKMSGEGVVMRIHKKAYFGPPGLGRGVCTSCLVTAVGDGGGGFTGFTGVGGRTGLTR